MRVHAWPVRFLMLLVLAVPFLFALPAQTAQAEVENGRYLWSENVKDIERREIITHPNGSVTVASCYGRSTSRARTFNVLGMTEGSPIYQANANFCRQAKAADGSGTVYGVDTENSTVVAFRNGTKLWEQALNACTRNLEPQRLVIGADGYLYALTTQRFACNQEHTHIFRLNTSDGSYGAHFGVRPMASELVVYRDGFIAISGEQAAYFRYDGTPLATVPFEGASPGVFEGSTMDGKIYFHSYRGLQPGEDDCNGADFRRYTIRGYSPTGKVFHYNVLRCTSFLDVTVASNGAVILLSHDYSKEDALRSIKVDGYGTYHTVRVPLPKSEGQKVFTRYYGSKLITDAKGTVIVHRRFTFPHGNGDSRGGSQFEARSAKTLLVKSRFSTDEIAATSTFASSGEGVLGAVDGKLYFVASSCDSASCTSDSPVRLYAVSMDVGMDYPRGALQPTQTPTPTCPSLLFVGVRGSGESGDSAGGLGTTVGDVRDRLAQQFPHMKTTAIDYAAVDIGYGNWVGYAAEYNRSVEGGKQNLRNYLDYIIASCPNVGIVGVGYSQGAHVVGDIFSDLPADKQERVAAMVLLGDPRFNPEQPEVNDGTHDDSQSGITQQPRVVPTGLVQKTKSYCLDKDPVCSLDPTDLGWCVANASECMHSKYVSTGWTRKAADWTVIVTDSS